MFIAHGNQTQDVNAFSIDWSNFNFFAVPPFSLTPRCVQNPSRCGQHVHKRGSHLFCNCYTANRGYSNHQQTCYAMPTSRPAIFPYRFCTGSQFEFLSSRRQWECWSVTSTTQEPALDGLSFIRNIFAQQNLSPDITNILMASWRKGTQNQYKTYVEKWLSFCGERKIDHSSPQINEAP